MSLSIFLQSVMLKILEIEIYFFSIYTHSQNEKQFSCCFLVVAWFVVSCFVLFQAFLEGHFLGAFFWGVWFWFLVCLLFGVFWFSFISMFLFGFVSLFVFFNVFIENLGWELFWVYNKLIFVSLPWICLGSPLTLPWLCLGIECWPWWDGMKNWMGEWLFLLSLAVYRLYNLDGHKIVELFW